MRTLLLSTLLFALACGGAATESPSAADDDALETSGGEETYTTPTESQVDDPGDDSLE